MVPMSSKLPYVLGAGVLLAAGFLLYQRSKGPAAPADAPKAAGKDLRMLADNEKVARWQLDARRSAGPTANPVEYEALSQPVAPSPDVSIDMLAALMNKTLYVLIGTAPDGTATYHFAAPNENVPSSFAIYLAPGEWQRIQGLAGLGYQLTPSAMDAASTAASNSPNAMSADCTAALSSLPEPAKSAMQLAAAAAMQQSQAGQQAEAMATMAAFSNSIRAQYPNVSACIDVQLSKATPAP